MFSYRKYILHVNIFSENLRLSRPAALNIYISYISNDRFKDYKMPIEQNENCNYNIGRNQQQQQQQQQQHFSVKIRNTPLLKL